MSPYPPPFTWPPEKSLLLLASPTADVSSRFWSGPWPPSGTGIDWGLRRPRAALNRKLGRGVVARLFAWVLFMLLAVL